MSQSLAAVAQWSPPVGLVSSLCTFSTEQNADAAHVATAGHSPGQSTEQEEKQRRRKVGWEAPKQNPSPSAELRVSSRSSSLNQDAPAPPHDHPSALGPRECIPPPKTADLWNVGQLQPGLISGNLCNTAGGLHGREVHHSSLFHHGWAGGQRADHTQQDDGVRKTCGSFAQPCFALTPCAASLGAL